MEFTLQNCSLVKVAAMVDGKEIVCVPWQVVTIKGDKVELYLPDYEVKKEAHMWSNYSYTHAELEKYATIFSVWSFPLDPDPEGTRVPQFWANFRFSCPNGMIQKVCVWTDDGSGKDQSIRHPIRKLK